MDHTAAIVRYALELALDLSGTVQRHAAAQHAYALACADHGTDSVSAQSAWLSMEHRAEQVRMTRAKITRLERKVLARSRQ